MASPIQEKHVYDIFRILIPRQEPVSQKRKYHVMNYGTTIALVETNLMSPDENKVRHVSTPQKETIVERTLSQWSEITEL